MLTWKLSEGNAMDILSIDEVKMNKNPSPKNIDNFFTSLGFIEAELGKFKTYDIKNSKEYEKLYKTNEKLFDVIEECQTKKRFYEASFPNYLNFCRWHYKNRIQEKFFKERTNEIKIGYDNWYFIECANYFPLCLLSKEDFDKFKNESISTDINNSYFHCYGKKYAFHKTILLEAGFQIEKGQWVDHKNRNIWDNRRENLRICSPHQSSFNRSTLLGISGYKGVSWNTYRQKWIVVIKNKKAIQIGQFDNKEDAAIAYDIYAKKIQGDFAHINIPNPDKDQYNKVFSLLKERENSRYNNKYYGVNFDQINNKWRAEFRHKNQYYYIGLFESEDEANISILNELRALGWEYLSINYQNNKNNQVKYLS